LIIAQAESKKLFSKKKRVKLLQVSSNTKKTPVLHTSEQIKSSLYAKKEEKCLS
jgi:hypothetical protein